MWTGEAWAKSCRHAIHGNSLTRELNLPVGPYSQSLSNTEPSFQYLKYCTDTGEKREKPQEFRQMIITRSRSNQKWTAEAGGGTS